MRHEPFVTNSEIVKNLPATVNVSSEIITALAIAGTRNPVQPTVISRGNVQLLQQLFGPITKTSHKSVYQAAKLLQSCSILVVGCIPQGIAKKRQCKLAPASDSAIQGINVAMLKNWVLESKLESTEDFITATISKTDQESIVRITWSNFSRLVNINPDTTLDSVQDIESLNFVESLPFKVVKVQASDLTTISKQAAASSDKSSLTLTFGQSSVSSDNALTTNLVKNAKAAYQQLLDYERYKATFIFDGFFNESSISSMCVTIAETKNSLAILSIATKQSATERTNLVKGLSVNSSYAMCFGDNGTDTTVAEFPTEIAGGVYYIGTVCTNQQIGNEFAPVYWLTHGSCGLTNPASGLYLSSKQDRETLLTAGANSVKFSDYYQTAYFNNNLTMIKSRSIVDEEFNRRMMNKIKVDCTEILQQFIGRINTDALRSEVRKVINQYYTQTFSKLNFRPQSFKVICDDSNNSPDVIDNGTKLFVEVRGTFMNSIKEINFLAVAVPLS